MATITSFNTILNLKKSYKFDSGYAIVFMMACLYDYYGFLCFCVVFTVFQS